MRVEPQQLKAFLVDSGLISATDADKFEKESSSKKKDFGELLIKEGKISEEDLSKLSAYILGIPFVNLENEKIDFKILSFIPEPIARTHNIVSFKKTGNELEVAMLDPENLETIDFIKKKANLKILPRLTTKNSIKNLLSQYNKSLKAEFEAQLLEEAKLNKAIAENLAKVKA